MTLFAFLYDRFSLPFLHKSSRFPHRLHSPWAASPVRFGKASLKSVWGSQSQHWDEDHRGTGTLEVGCYQCTVQGKEKYQKYKEQFNKSRLWASLNLLLKNHSKEQFSHVAVIILWKLNNNWIMRAKAKKTVYIHFKPPIKFENPV